MLRETGAARTALAYFVALTCAVSGCGTTRTTNTQRTATEQLLISDAIDRAVQTIDFRPLAGQDVYFDDRQLYEVVDDAYLISSLRQHMLASGCILKEEKEQATYIVEPRAGAIGTDNHDLLFGMPATNVPQFTLLAALPPAIPEIPIAKRRNQRGVAKIAVFAYHRESGEPAWQSGIATRESTANDIWVLGAGPFKRGTIHKGTYFAGDKLALQAEEEKAKAKTGIARLNQEAVFRRVAPPVVADSGEQAGEDKQEALASEKPPAEIGQSLAEVPVNKSTNSPGPPVLPPPVRTASAESEIPPE